MRRSGLPSEPGTVYLATVGVVAAVTILALSGAALRAQFRDRSLAVNEAAEARRLARSAAEAAIVNIEKTDGWRAQAATGSILGSTAFGGGEVAVSVVDDATNGLPTDATSIYRVIAEGQAGDARARLAYEVGVSGGVSPYEQILIDCNAYGYWPLDEVDASIASEVVMLSGNDGVYQQPDDAGAETHIHGNPAPAIDWHTGGVRVEHDNDFEQAVGTLCFWVYYDALPFTFGWQNAAVSKEEPSEDKSAHLAAYLDRDGFHVKLDNQGDDGSTISAAGVIDAKTWHFVAITWGDALVLYVDGVEVARDDRNTLGLKKHGNDLDANESPWYFGVRNINVMGFQPAWPTYGSVARVGFMKKQIDPSVINDLYAASTNGEKLELVRGSFRRVVD